MMMMMSIIDPICIPVRVDLDLPHEPLVLHVSLPILCFVYF